MAGVRPRTHPVSLLSWVAGVIDLPDDFRDILIELADAGVEFVVVGGYAVAVHGHSRATKDIDIFVRADPANADRVYRALAAFGAPLPAFHVTASDFAEEGNVLQLGVPPLRIDVITRASGITFDEASVDAVYLDVAGRRVPVIGLAALLQNKRSTGRLQDLADVEALAPGGGK